MTKMYIRIKILISLKMKNNLVIVESGAKGKTLSKYLNVKELSHHGSFKVIASNGHIRDLKKKSRY